MFKKALFILFIVLISGTSAICADRYLFPYLAATKLFSKYEFLKKTTENVTVINKTEQVYIKEASSINQITNQTSSSIVNIISYSDGSVRDEKSLIKNGTGVVITSDGIVMTYLTAINPKNSRYKVMTYDGNVYDGEIIGIDSWSNLVFIKIYASNLPVLAFANSDEYASGEKVIAIENDLPQYQNQFRSGLLNSFDPFFNISGQTLGMAKSLEGVFLLDFSDPSTSVGGPVIDFSGQAIGIIGSVLTDGRNEFFAIPANKVKAVINKAINKELETNPSLGVYYIMLNRSWVAANNLKIDRGAMIYSPSDQQGLAVIAGSPAALAGFQLGDIITRAGEEDLDIKNNLSDILYKYKKGDRLEFSVLRGAEEMKIPVQL